MFFTLGTLPSPPWIIQIVLTLLYFFQMDFYSGMKAFSRASTEMLSTEQTNKDTWESRNNNGRGHLHLNLGRNGPDPKKCVLHTGPVWHWCIPFTLERWGNGHHWATNIYGNFKHWRQRLTATNESKQNFWTLADVDFVPDEKQNACTFHRTGALEEIQ